MSWPFAAQLAGAFADAGAWVQALAPAGSLLARSRHPLCHHLYSSLAPADSLARAVAASRPDMIIACDDLAARLVAQLQGQASPRRLDFMRRAAEAGAPVAATQEIACEDDIAAAIARLGLPLVLKLDHSWGGEGVVIAGSRNEAIAGFRRLSRQGRSRNLLRALRGRGAHFLTQALYPVSTQISAQRFVKGMAATSSIACWQGEVVAAHHFDVLLCAAPTSPASVIAISDCEEMAAAARAVASAFRLSGLFGLDYIRDDSGHVHLLEMNARATPTMHLALEQDLAASLLKAAGFAARFRRPVTDKREIALFPREWLRDPASPWLGRAYHDVPWDDPEVVRACVRGRPVDAEALLENIYRPALTAEKAVFGA